MRLLLLSDLHTEFVPFTPASVDADVVILAGDIGTGIRGVQWAARAFPHVPVLYVPGNHEYYGGALPRIADKMRAAAEGTSVTVLERDVTELGGVRFLGTTLWTDFALFGDSEVWTSYEHARDRMNDYRKIRRSPRFRKLRPEDTRRLFMTSLHWLRTELETSSAMPSVIITHHAPSLRSVQPRYHTDDLAPAYASRLDEFVANSGAMAWVHGHTHHCVDYRLGDTRVVSNQRGYPSEPVPGFDPGFVFDVAVAPPVAAGA